MSSTKLTWFNFLNSILHLLNISSIGLNSGVVKHIEEPGVYVGSPAKKIK